MKLKWAIGIALFALGAVALTGCVYVEQGNATKGKTALVGKTRSQILACAGVPNETYKNGSSDYFAYDGTGRTRISMVPVGGNMIAGVGRQSQCTVTLGFKGDRVATVNYRAGGGLLTPEEACGPIVKSCL